MNHWMLWTVGLGLALGPALPAGSARAVEKAAEKPAAKRAAAVSLPAEDWAVTAVSREGGEFDYCAAGTRYDNGHALLIAKNRADEVVVIIGLPEPRLNPKSLLPTKLTIDQRGTRQGSGLVTRPSALAVSLGKDASFFEAIRRGNTLAIDNPDVKLSLSLRGSGAALANLNSCVQSDGRTAAKPLTITEAPPAPTPGPAADAPPAPIPGPAADAPKVPAPTEAAAAVPEPPPAAVQAEPPATPAAATATPPTPGNAQAVEAAPELVPPPVGESPAVNVASVLPMPAPPAGTAPDPVPPPAAAPPILGPALPDALVNLLSAAGMAGIVPVSLDRVAPDQRPATFAWKYGQVFGGIREVSIIDNRSLAELTESYVTVLKNSCSGEFRSSLGPVEQLREITLRIGEATCVLPERTTEFRHVYYINRARIFTTFIHESDTAGKAMAEKARDQLASVIRQVATAAR
ncbi:hypothetical protein JL100_003200 [Skermanella mucosa]|uniref:hypothetical protein n=1 Tax=Skermanella mucosa TaxID=1789672 RepID=UPI00192C1EA8|nr:hypothetical protein [Skermanella mucosa]UEM21788.1 hypothetical protein JL100_003200 [Skermanella mucosa]